MDGGKGPTRTRKLPTIVWRRRPDGAWRGGRVVLRRPAAWVGRQWGWRCGWGCGRWAQASGGMVARERPEIALRRFIGRAPDAQHDAHPPRTRDGRGTCHSQTWRPSSSRGLRDRCLSSSTGCPKVRASLPPSTTYPLGPAGRRHCQQASMLQPSWPRLSSDRGFRSWRARMTILTIPLRRRLWPCTLTRAPSPGMRPSFSWGCSCILTTPPQRCRRRPLRQRLALRSGHPKSKRTCADRALMRYSSDALKRRGVSIDCRRCMHTCPLGNDDDAWCSSIA